MEWVLSKEVGVHDFLRTIKDDKETVDELRKTGGVVETSKTKGV